MSTNSNKRSDSDFWFLVCTVMLVWWGGSYYEQDKKEKERAVIHEQGLQVDQCVRNDLYKACVSTLPPGAEPGSDELKRIRQCSDTAAREALRPHRAVEPACRVPYL